MKLLILISLLLPLVAQERTSVIGTTDHIAKVGTTHPQANFITIDTNPAYFPAVVLIRQHGLPIGFCNARLGRCWDVKPKYTMDLCGGSATLRIWDDLMTGATRLVIEAGRRQ